jgi:ribosome-binding factor A
MPSKGNRPERVAEAMRSELAVLIAERLSGESRHAKAGLATVTAVKLSGDLQVARIFVSFIGGDDKSAEGAIESLERAAGGMRGEIARRLAMRRAPDLRFVLDKTAEEAARIERLIKGED